MAINKVATEFINYWLMYGDDSNSDRDEAAGDWACKYCDDQPHVLDTLDQIDKYFENEK